MQSNSMCLFFSSTIGYISQTLTLLFLTSIKLNTEPVESLLILVCLPYTIIYWLTGVNGKHIAYFICAVVHILHDKRKFHVNLISIYYSFRIVTVLMLFLFINGKCQNFIKKVLTWRTATTCYV